MTSGASLLRVHVAGGTVWSGDETQLAEDSGQSPAEFVDQFDERGVPLAAFAIRVLGVPGNAKLIGRLAAAVTAGVCIAAPAVVPAAALRIDPTAVLHYLWQPPLASCGLGLWNAVRGPADYCTYVIMGEVAVGGAVSEIGLDLLRDHPAWPVLSFAGGDLAAAARLVCQIGDPRWYTHPVRPGRWTRLFSRLGLTPAAVLPGVCERIEAVAAWRRSPLPAFAADEIAHYGAIRGTLRAAQVFAVAVAWVWLDVLEPSGPDAARLPFDPARLFGKRAAEAYRKHRQTVGY